MSRNPKMTLPAKQAGRNVDKKLSSRTEQYASNTITAEMEIDKLMSELEYMSFTGQSQNGISKEVMSRNPKMTLPAKQAGRNVDKKLSSRTEQYASNTITAEMEIDKLMSELEYMRATSPTESTGSGYMIVQGPPPDSAESLKTKLIQLLEQELHKVKTQLESKGEELEMRDRCFKQKKRDMKVRMCKQEQEIGTLNKQLIEARQAGDNSAEETRLKKELEEAKRKCEKLGAAKSDLENTCHDAFEKLDKMEMVIKSLTATHKKTIENKEKTIISLRKEISNVDPAADSARVKLKEINSNHAQTTTKLREVTEECDLLRVRLSTMAGDQLVNNTDANITDLSDEKIPTKLGERYSELYDNEWTDAFEENEIDQGYEEKCVKYLYTMLQDIHTFCQKLSKDQSDKLKKYVRTIPESNSKNTPTSDIPEEQLRMLKDIRKSFANDQVDDVMQHYIDTKKPKLDGKPSTKTYARSCIEVCWLMSVQDPPVIINDKITSGAFDEDLFRSYTKTGKQLAYVVWPPLLLHENGAMLSKGVAQGK